VSFSQSFAYPFNNLAKILKIVLIFLLIIASITVGSIMLQVPILSLMTIPLILGYALFSSGYMVSVIREVADGSDMLPEVELGRDLGQGFAVMVIGLIYALPLIVLFVIGLLAIAVPVGSGGGSFMPILLLGLVFVVLAFIFSYTAMIGMIRYAVSGNANEMLRFGENFSLFFSNVGAIFGLIWRTMLIGFIYGFVSGLTETVFQGMMFGISSQTMLYVLLTVYMVGYMAVTFMNQIAQAHLIAGFGLQTGIIHTSDKQKLKRYTI